MHYNRQSLIVNMATDLMEDMRLKEELIGLTVGRDFKSYYTKIREDRESRARLKHGVTMYEGQVPMH